MKLSELVQSNIFESLVGSIRNTFKIKKRRNTLFFEEILSSYIKVCEKKGFEKDMKEIGHTWALMTTSKLMPSPIRLLPPVIIVNDVLNSLWHNIGLADKVSVKESGNNIIFSTKNGAIERVIGRNSFIIGLVQGTIEAIFQKKVEIGNIEFNENETHYRLIKTAEAPHISETKNISLYNSLNTIPSAEGFSLTRSLEANVFNIKGNQIYFRGKSILPLENTLFHLLGSKKILLDELSIISYNFFNDIIEKDVSYAKKLNLLKNLTQILGWGITSITFTGTKDITVQLMHPPHGLQLEKENYLFLAKTIQGYVMHVNKKLKLRDLKEVDKTVIMKFHE